jgi:NTP pyrophosphatase (non-canonical NTP hydrolase)
MAAYNKAQIEILYLLMEECSEVIQAATKCLRHGEDSYNPHEAGGPHNRDALNKELGHVTLALQLALEQGLIDEASIERYRRAKRDMIARWLHHSSPSPREG